MRHLLWLVPLVAGLAAMQWPRLQGLALLTMLVCGVTYLVVRARRPVQSVPPLGAEEKRDFFGVQRDLPPPPG